MNVRKAPNPTAAEEISGRGEQYKALFDHIKHIATLSTGTILILFTLLQNFIKQPVARGLAKASVAAFLLSVVAGVVLFGVLAVRFPRRGVSPMTQSERDFVATTLLVAWMSFLIGVACLGIFFWMNF